MGYDHSQKTIQVAPSGNASRYNFSTTTFEKLAAAQFAFRPTPSRSVHIRGSTRCSPDSSRRQNGPGFRTQRLQA
jgi:hypothetical protein